MPKVDTLGWLEELDAHQGTPQHWFRQLWSACLKHPLRIHNAPRGRITAIVLLRRIYGDAVDSVLFPEPDSLAIGWQESDRLPADDFAPRAFFSKLLHGIQKHEKSTDLRELATRGLEWLDGVYPAPPPALDQQAWKSRGRGAAGQ